MAPSKAANAWLKARALVVLACLTLPSVIAQSAPIDAGMSPPAPPPPAPPTMAADATTCNMEEYQVMKDSAAVLGAPEGWADSSSCHCGPAPGAWTGVTCTERGPLGRVLAIKLEDMPLKGSLPVEWTALAALENITVAQGMSGVLPVEWSAMKAIKHIDVGNNSFLFATLPTEWSTLTGLQTVRLRDSGLGGMLPKSWSVLTNLEYLTLSRNNFQGDLPIEWSEMASLKSLSFFGNGQLQGVLPDAYSNLKKLESLDMGRTYTSGTLPKGWSAMERMRLLDVTTSNITGTLPAEWSAMKSLSSLGLYGAGEKSMGKLTGSLPDAWSSLANLTRLYLNLNQIQGSLPLAWSALNLIHLDVSFNNISGTLPDAWSGLSSLTMLASRKNNLSGALPLTWSEMKLQILDLGQNNMNGSLPEEYSAMKGLWTVVLEENHFTSTLPRSWQNIASLNFLYLSKNEFNGGLPHEWQSMTQLEALDVSSNQLTSSLPEEWSGLVNIVEGDFGNNSFSSSLPPSWSKWTKAQSLNFGRNELTGNLPTEWTTMTNLTILDLHKNNIIGQVPTQWSKLTSLKLLDVSSNHLSGGLPKEWSDLQKLEYLGLHDNNPCEDKKYKGKTCTVKGLCKPSQDCINVIDEHFTMKLNLLTVTGGADGIPSEVCEVHQSDLTNSSLKTLKNVELVYVGTEPARDDCFNKLCIDREAYKYPIAWFSVFYPAEALPETKTALPSGSGPYKRAEVVDPPTFDSARFLSEGRVPDGWTLGTGDRRDPCVNRDAWQNVLLVCCIWVFAVLLVIWMTASRVKKARQLADTVQKQPTEKPAEQKKAPKAMHKPAVFKYGVRARLLNLTEYVFNMNMLALYIFDRGTNLNSARIYYGYYSFWWVLGAIIGTDFIASAYLFWVIRQRVKRELAADAAEPAEKPAPNALKLPGTKLEKLVKNVCLWSIRTGPLGCIAAGLLLTPALTIIVMAMTFSVVLPWFNGEKLAFCGLDIEKCLNVRSTFMSFIENPVTLGVNIWAFVEPFKWKVGVYLTAPTFYTAAFSSFLNMWLTAANICNTYVEKKGDWRKVAVTLFDAEDDPEPVQQPANSEPKV